MTQRSPTKSSGLRPPPGGGGMTLVEMLVAITVLTVMILAVSAIMTQSQRFISIAQASRRSHRTAASIARIIRADLRRISQDGFLCITRVRSANRYVPLLAFTTAGISHTIAYTGPGTRSASGSLVCYSEIENSCPPTERSAAYLLWRPEYVLIGDGSGAEMDRYGVGLTHMLRWKRGEFHSNVINGGVRALRDDAEDDDIAVPIGQNYATIGRLWQILARDCEQLGIMWTDGKTDNNGKPEPEDPKHEDLDWYGHDEDEGDPAYCGDESIEGPGYNNPPSYRALWTHHDQSNWPKAIKITFRLKDKRLRDYLPREMRREGHPFAEGFQYEVICNTGQ